MTKEQHRYGISVVGKWGGSRVITLAARNEQQARLKARELMQAHERISSVYVAAPLGHRLEGRAYRIDSDGRTRDPYTGEEVEL